MPFLSEMIKKPVVDNAGKTVGKLVDVIVSANRPIRRSMHSASVRQKVQLSPSRRGKLNA